jgi:hypothetical protein
MTGLNSAYYNAIDLNRLQLVYPQEYAIYKELVNEDSPVEIEYGVIDGLLKNPINDALWNNETYLYYKELAEKQLNNLLIAAY